MHGRQRGLQRQPLWVASYTTDARPAMPEGWGNWALWQYTSTATVPGIDSAGHTDLDALNLVAPGSQETASACRCRCRSARPSPGPRPGLSYTAAGLPAGLAVTPGGVVAGTPTATDAAQASTITAAAEGQVLGSVGVSWEVGGALSVPAPASQETPPEASGFTVPPASVPAGQTASYTATGLPPGLTISAAGQIAAGPAAPAAITSPSSPPTP